MGKENYHFIFGLIAGEGSFTVCLQHKDTAKYNVRGRPQMVIKLHERDSELVKMCHEKTGLGTYQEYGEYAGWHVNSKNDLWELIELIDEHAGEMFKGSDKYQSYLRWKDGMKILGEPYKRVSRDEVFEIIEIAKSINSTDHNFVTEEEWKDRVVE